jgi:predicted RNA-binding Zn-ribbon protein involved in translation (DUF1610 family)
MSSPQVPAAAAPSVATAAPHTCVSCGRSLRAKGAVEFPCPDCGELIGRCQQCRDQSVTYRCPHCGFSGP